MIHRLLASAYFQLRLGGEISDLLKSEIGTVYRFTFRDEINNFF